MAISNVFEKLGRAVFESPFGANRLAKDAPELAEIRLEVLDAVKAKSHRVGGKNVFPYDLVSIRLLGVPEEQEAIFQSEFVTRYFTDELKAGLARSSYRFPEDLTIEFVTVPRLPEKGESWISVETSMRPKSSQASDTMRPAALIVLKGTATRKRFVLEKTRTNIGRTADVFRAAAPSRRNDVVFTGNDAIDNTVSREHAHIVRTAGKGEYRLFNDRTYKGENNCGLWIVRDGLSFPVHRNSRGTLLEEGDEIYVGNAALRFSSEG
jgi:pSer/pThr/pTyr-binding forkhead associated (FHA) protein